MEHLLHLLSLSSSAGGVLNLSALALGLAALAFSLRALLRALAGRSIAGSLAIGGGACGVALLLQMLELLRRSFAGDWGGLYDVGPATALVSGLLLVTVLALTTTAALLSGSKRP